MQQLVRPPEFLVQAPCFRVLQEQARKVSPFRDGQLAVQFPLYQFLKLALVHAQRTPHVASRSFRSCRAVYRRDLTVLASMARTSAISS